MNKTKTFANIAIIAALYTAVSLALASIYYGNIQVRIAEGLTLLPLVFQPAIYGVTLGCFLTNLIGAMTGANLLGFMDCIIGTLATFLAAICTYKLRDIKMSKLPVLSILMPVIFNMIIIGAELGYCLFPKELFLQGSIISGLEVAAGELVSVILGWFLLQGLIKTKIFEGRQ